MFDIGWDEMALIATVALIVIGPKQLPEVLRQGGRWVRKARALTADFRHSLDEMVRESELAELKDQVGRFTQPGSMRIQLENTIDPTGEIATALKPPAFSLEKSPPPLVEEETPVIETPPPSPGEVAGGTEEAMTAPTPEGPISPPKP